MRLLRKLTTGCGLPGRYINAEQTDLGKMPPCTTSVCESMQEHSRRLGPNRPAPLHPSPHPSENLLNYLHQACQRCLSGAELADSGNTAYRGQTLPDSLRRLLVLDPLGPHVWSCSSVSLAAYIRIVSYRTLSCRSPLAPATPRCLRLGMPPTAAPVPKDAAARLGQEGAARPAPERAKPLRLQSKWRRHSTRRLAACDRGAAQRPLQTVGMC